MEVWYLAHPVKGDEFFSFEENMAHTIKVMRILFDVGLITVAPWHTHCLALNDKDPVHRSLGLLSDLEIVKRLRRVVLTGHRTSPGMRREIGVPGIELLTFVGIEDDYLAKAARIAIRKRKSQ